MIFINYLSMQCFCIEKNDANAYQLMRFQKCHGIKFSPICSHSIKKFLRGCCDYFSNYIEMEKLRSQMSPVVINDLKAMFASCHGIPNTVVSDNSAANPSEELNKFATMWEFNHVTTSPQYLQSNGKADSAVKTCKILLKNLSWLILI